MNLAPVACGTSLILVLAGCANSGFECDTTPRREGQCTVFRVDSRVMQNTTGITPRPGERMRLTIGQSEPPWQDAWLSADPETGWPWWAMGGLFQWRARTPHAPMYSLVCATSPDVSTGWAVVSGETVEPHARGSGPMTCFANDWAPHWAYANNRGCLKVTVCPAQE